MAKKLTHQEFLDRFNKLDKSLYFDIHSEYNGHQKKMLFSHNSDNCPNKNEIFEGTPNNMLKEKYGCPFCAQNKRTTTKRKNSSVNIDIFEKKMIEVYGEGEYTLEPGQEYINNKTPIKIKHKCGKVFGISYVNLCKGKGCPDCNRRNILNSKGTLAIEAYLKENNFKYAREVKLDGCIFKGQLSFDFEVEINGDKIYIEYDGEQHFTTYRKNKDELEKTKLRDKAKNNFCWKNNLELLRIDYKNLNKINDILDDYLKNENYKVQRLVHRTYTES